MYAPILPKPILSLHLPSHSHSPFIRLLSFAPLRATSNDSSTTTGDGNNSAPTQPPKPSTATEAVEIRFRRGARKRRQQEREQDTLASEKPRREKEVTPKSWDEMTLQEKALELYVGEKGMLFWLNKFAYASIYIIIGAWILFRFVGPALNLYQLDSAPLSPESIFKG